MIFINGLFFPQNHFVPDMWDMKCNAKRVFIVYEKGK